MFRSNAPASNRRSTVQEIQPSTRIFVIGARYAGLLFTMRLAGKVASQNVHIALVNESDTFTGRLGYLIREGFVHYLAAATQRPGIFVWVGKRRYEHAQHQQQAQAKKHAMQLHRVR